MIWEAWAAIGVAYTGGAVQISRHLAGHWNYRAWKLKKANGYGYDNFETFDDRMRGERAVWAFAISFCIMPLALAINKMYSGSENGNVWAIDPPQIRKEIERKKMAELEKELEVG